MIIRLGSDEHCDVELDLAGHDVVFVCRLMLQNGMSKVRGIPQMALY